MPDFSTLALIDALQRSLKGLGYTHITPVQASSLPAILAGRDVVAQPPTGSGKTAAFALGLLAALDAASVTLQGLALCPTRELADQVSREIRRLAGPYSRADSERSAAFTSHPNSGDAEIPAMAVGKIDVFPTRTYVAIAREWHDQALRRLLSGKIKGRTFQIRRIGG